MFPGVLFVDTVEKINNKKNPILVVSGKDSDGKMISILRALFPNEK